MTTDDAVSPGFDGLNILTGVSTSRDSIVAANELYEQVYQPDIDLCLFYCSPEYDLKTLGDELNRLFGEVNLIGCTSSGEITPVGYLKNSLTGVSLSGDGVHVVTQRLDDVDQFEISRGSDISRSLINDLAHQSGVLASSENTFGFLLIDGLCGKEEVVVSSVHHGLGSIQLCGGSAADNEVFSETLLFSDGEFRSNCALLSLVQLDNPFTVFKTQHFVASDTKMVVTEVDSRQRTVKEINGAPAGREYADILGFEVSKLTPQIFSDHPVIVKIGGDNFVRSILKVNKDESLLFACAIDEGVVMTMAHGKDMTEDLEGMFETVQSRIGEPILTLGFDCVFRRMEMDKKGLQGNIGRIMMKNKVIGFSTYGEQYNASHINQTFTAIAIGAKQEG